mgnify:CR=1 FL=1
MYLKSSSSQDSSSDMRAVVISQGRQQLTINVIPLSQKTISPKVPYFAQIYSVVIVLLLFHFVFLQEFSNELHL